MRGREVIDAVKAALRDPAEVCRRLGLLEGARRQGNGLLIRCPAHRERTPSCSVTRGPDATLRVRCFGCDLSGDVLSLVAAADSFDLRRDFALVLDSAAEIAGLDLDASRARPASTPAHQGRTAPRPRTPPPAAEVTALWSACAPCSTDPEVAAWLRSRGLDASVVDRFGLARALPPRATLPAWARYRGAGTEARPWPSAGYRAVFPLYDAAGQLRSVRARLTSANTGSNAPKSLPPAGYSIGGLVLASSLAVLVLQVAAWRARGDAAAVAHGGDGWPERCDRRVVVTEGEPDFLSWAAREPTPPPFAVLGLPGSGAWSAEIAAALPEGCTVLVRTDPDDAGDRYAEQIAESLLGRCQVLEMDPEERAARRRARLLRNKERSPT